MRLRLLLAVAAAAALTAPPARAADDPASLAAAVGNEIVHVEPRARQRVSVAEEGRLRLRIAQKANGRIKILVVPSSTAEANGGVGSLAQTVAAQAQLRGALLAVAGDDVFVVSSYDSGAAREAVQGAFDARGKLVPALTESVDRLAAADPGPSGDAGAAPPPGSPADGLEDTANDFLDDIGDTIRTVFFAIAAAIIFVLIVPFAIWFVRARRRRAEGAEDLELDRAHARDELIAIGDILRELDVDVAAPGADPAGRDALSRAIDLYDRADRDLKKADTRRRLERAQASLYRARSAAELARQRLAGAPAGLSLDA